MMRYLPLLVAFFSFSFFSGCTEGGKHSVVEEIPPSGLAGMNNSPLNHANLGTDEQLAMSKQQADRPVLTGKITEAMYKDSYAYLNLQLASGDFVWVAVVNKKPSVGDKISVQEQVILKDFHSKSLDRTFAQIVFGPVVE